MAGMRTHTKRKRRSRPGVQHLWGFDNGRLASAVPEVDGRRLWQLTILDGNGRPRGSAPEMPSVIGALRPVEVRRILREVESLR
jgi:hypothetical protein